MKVTGNYIHTYEGFCLEKCPVASYYNHLCVHIYQELNFLYHICHNLTSRLIHIWPHCHNTNITKYENIIHNNGENDTMETDKYLNSTCKYDTIKF